MSENPAAFPCTGEGFGSELYTQKGMTLRDYFAGQALATVLLGNHYDENGYALSADMRPKAYAQDAYQIADAMLAERSKSHPMTETPEQGER